MNHQLTFREVDRDKFEAIKAGYKKVETRAGGPQHPAITPGDIIEFHCGKETVTKHVKDIQIYRSVKELLSDYRPDQIIPAARSGTEVQAAYWEFPGYQERIEKYGLVAISLD